MEMTKAILLTLPLTLVLAAGAWGQDLNCDMAAYKPQEGLKAQLHGGIPITFGRADLGDETRPRLHHRHTLGGPIFGKYLGHADFAADDALNH